MAVKKEKGELISIEGFSLIRFFFQNIRKHLSTINQDFSSSFAKNFCHIRRIFKFYIFIPCSLPKPKPQHQVLVIQSITTHGNSTNLCADAVQISYQKTEKLVQQNQVGFFGVLKLANTYLSVATIIQHLFYCRVC